MAKILVADDEPDVLESTRLLLADLGHQVLTTGRAAEILPLLGRERPDVLLQDVRMPSLDVEALLAAIRADPAVAAVRIVLFTASMDAAGIQSRVAAEAVLEKPFGVDELEEAVAAALAAPAAGGPLAA